MIKKIETATEFSDYKIIDIYSIRILSLLEAYGTSYDFASFYKQINDNGEITAIISKLDGDITISSTICDYSELIEFIEVIGYTSCLCSGLDGYEHYFEQGIIMSSNRKTEISLPYTELDEFPKLMDIYNFDDYEYADFELWYVDASHRIRHNCAKAYTLNVNGEIAASGIFSAIYKDNAILSAVQTSPEFRRMGYGSSLVSSMLCDIKGTVYLMRETNKNEEFYKKTGFENIGIWRMYK